MWQRIWFKIQFCVRLFRQIMASFSFSFFYFSLFSGVKSQSRFRTKSKFGKVKILKYDHFPYHKWQPINFQLPLLLDGKAAWGFQTFRLLKKNLKTHLVQNYWQIYHTFLSYVSFWEIFLIIFIQIKKKN